ncbi:MAG: Flagellar assembly factor FliW [Holosporales bacterium]
MIKIDRITPVKMNTRLGRIDIQSENIYVFEEGLFGFSSAKNFVLSSVPYHEERSPFFMMQCLDDANICFIGINADLDINDLVSFYPTILDEQDIQAVAQELYTPAEYLRHAFLVSLNGEMTMNTTAPLFFDFYQKLGYQVILKNPAYDIRQKIFHNTHRDSKL